jgi:hypothetical protein
MLSDQASPGSPEKDSLVSLEAADSTRAHDDFKVVVDKAIVGCSEQKDDDTFMGYTPLVEDTYSLIFTAKAGSAAFIFAISVFCFQATIIWLILWDLIDPGKVNPLNPLKIPPRVDIQVTIVQGLSLLLAVMTQGDLLTAVIHFHAGYDGKKLLKINTSFTFGKWLTAGVLQFFVGSTKLVVTFISMLQRTTVISIMANFAALSFVAEIDDIAYSLAKRGFALDSVERECELMTEYKIPRKRKSNIFRRVVFLIIFAGLVCGYGYVVHLQLSGIFLPSTLFAQFGGLSQSFSGVYDQGDKLNGRRVVYIERKRKKARFAYCKKENAWTFSRNEDACDWDARSPEQPASYDITTTTVSGWLGRSGEKLLVLIDNDCATSGLCPSERGECVNNECICHEGRFGLNCEFSEPPCERLDVDQRWGKFPSLFGAFHLSSSYKLLLDDNETPVEVYNRPVYVENLARNPASIEVIMFLGRNWAVVFSDHMSGDRGDHTLEIEGERQLARYLSEDFHGYYSSYFVILYSGPRDFGTTSDSLYSGPSDVGSTDALAPVDLVWYDNIDQPENHPLETNLLCGVCDADVNICRNLIHECNNGTCECILGFTGSLCECEPNCVVDGCNNTGICVEATGICENCAEGFCGDLCQIEIGSIFGILCGQ